jgi:ribonucleotide monophosphatase NagD (HAD superfamily)
MSNHQTSHLDKIKFLADKAKTYLETRAVNEKPQLVVFDIDGTVIDDTDPISGTGYFRGYPPMLELYSSLRASGYVIIFLTARQERFRILTEGNLKHVGYSWYENLVMMPDTDNPSGHPIWAVGVWKDEQRKKFKEDGFHLVACIGDQDADVCGDHIGEYQVRLPIPPKAGLTGLFGMFARLRLTDVKQ